MYVEEIRTCVVRAVENWPLRVRRTWCRMLHVRVRLFVRGERWLGHGQGDALIFPWREREAAGRRTAEML